MHKITLIGYVWVGLALMATLAVFASDNGLATWDENASKSPLDTQFTQHLLTFSTAFKVCLIILALGFVCVNIGRWRGKK